MAHVLTDWSHPHNVLNILFNPQEHFCNTDHITFQLTTPLWLPFALKEVHTPFWAHKDLPMNGSWFPLKLHLPPPQPRASCSSPFKLCSSHTGLSSLLWTSGARADMVPSTLALPLWPPAFYLLLLPRPSTAFMSPPQREACPGHRT